jgi:hypothetical protein
VFVFVDGADFVTLHRRNRGGWCPCRVTLREVDTSAIIVLLASVPVAGGLPIWQISYSSTARPVQAIDWNPVSVLCFLTSPDTPRRWVAR